MYYINAQSIHTYDSTSYAEHLKSIKAHWSRLKAKRKAAKLSREAESKPPVKAYSFRFNKKGTPVLTIRKRKPAYLYRCEWLELETAYPEHREVLQTVLAKRSITIKPDKK
jgi:hypothetical protein